MKPMGNKRRQCAQRLQNKLKGHGYGQSLHDKRVSATQRDNTLAANLPVAWPWRHTDLQVVIRGYVQQTRLRLILKPEDVGS